MLCSTHATDTVHLMWGCMHTADKSVQLLVIQGIHSYTHAKGVWPVHRLRNSYSLSSSSVTSSSLFSDSHLALLFLWSTLCGRFRASRLQERQASSKCQHLPSAQLDASRWTAKQSKHLLLSGVTVQKLLRDVQINVLISSVGELDSNLHT